MIYQIGIWLITSLLFTSTTSARRCYHPGGSDANDPWDVPNNSSYQPCNTDENSHSMCCAKWNTCMPNGLCFDHYNYGQIWRESCTDPTFADPACLRLYVNIPEDLKVGNCTDGSWCAGEDTSSCCEQGTGVFILPSNNTIPASSLNRTSGVLTTARATATIAISGSGPKHNSDIIGVVLGVGITCAIITILTAVFWFSRIRARAQARARASQQKVQEYMFSDKEACVNFPTPPPPPPPPPPAKGIDELDGSFMQPAFEKDGSPTRRYGSPKFEMHSVRIRTKEVQEVQA